MPGRRLSDEDRRRIEAWLAEGLGFAEIGRRLDRPTSTISREVVRNGTPGAYQADEAHQTAGERARRRKSPRPPAPTDGEGQGFVEEFAALLAATGLPRMTARVFASLLTAADDGLTAADLARSLQVSPASVSKSVAHLEAMELVARRTEPGSRRERYGINEDVWLRAWRADTGAHGAVAAGALRGVEIFGARTPAGARLAAMGRFFGQLNEEMSGSAIAGTVAHDALTAVAAFVHAGRPITVDDLAAALDWTRDRVAAAVEAIETHPAIGDPLELQEIGPETYAVTARPDRLTRAQRDGLASQGTEAPRGS